MFTFLEINTFVVFTNMLKCRKELSSDTKQAIVTLCNSGIKQYEIHHRLVWHANAVLCIKKKNCVASI